MYFCHTEDIWQQFPQLVPGMMIVDGITESPDPTPFIAPLLDRARDRLAGRTESEMPEISAWRKAFSQMGFKPTKYRSAAEALLRRFKKEDDLPRLHPLVDVCNAVSVAFALPVAALDLAHVDEFIHVRPARGDESYLAFNMETESPEPGEIIFADASDHVHARRWTFRQSRRSVISPETKRALIISEALHDTGAGDIPLLMDQLTKALTGLWHAPSPSTILSAANPRLDF